MHIYDIFAGRRSCTHCIIVLCSREFAVRKRVKRSCVEKGDGLTALPMQSSILYISIMKERECEEQKQRSSEIELLDGKGNRLQ